MKVYVLLLTLIVLSLFSASAIYAQQPVSPPIDMDSSMRVLVYPDGAIRVLYNLGISIENAAGKTTTGSILLSYREEITEDHMYVVFSGVGEVKPLSPGMKVSSSSFSMRSLFDIHGSVEGYVANGSIVMKASSVVGVERSYIVINVSRLNIAIGDQVVRLVFNIVAVGNITIPEEYIGEITNRIESEFSLRNIPWIKLKHVSIVKEGNAYRISGVLTILIDEIIKQELEFNIITEADAKEISRCIGEYYRELSGIVMLSADISTTNHVSRVSRFTESTFRFEFVSDLYGEIKQLDEVSRRCGLALNKLFMIIPLLVTAIQTPQPQQPPPIISQLTAFETKPFSLRRVYPYRATAKLLVKFDAGRVLLNLSIDSGRVTYVEDVDDPAIQAKLSLRELSSWIQQLDKQISILTPMGIPSPIPSTIELEGVEERGKSVVIEPSRTTVQGLGEVNVRIELVTRAPATQTPLTTVTLIKTTTVTETYTATVTKTLTKTYTETLTMKTTIVKEGLATSTVIAVSAISIMVIAVLVLVLFRILRR